jgi:hypothetical protein
MAAARAFQKYFAVNGFGIVAKFRLNNAPSKQFPSEQGITSSSNVTTRILYYNLGTLLKRTIPEHDK